jgi:hypothetical protein
LTPISGQKPIRLTVLWPASQWEEWKHTPLLGRPEVFSHFGLLSGGTYTPEEIKDKSKVKLIFLSSGSFENPDGVTTAAAELKEAGINAVSFVSENTRHEFQTWRRSLYHMAQLMFK